MAPPDLGSRSEACVSVRWGSVVAVLADEAGARRKGSPPPVASGSRRQAMRFGPPRRWGTGGQSPRPRPKSFLLGEEVGRSVAVRDAQAGVPSAGWPRAQLAFKDSMVRGILQFTPGIAFRYVLHRCESRDIRCRESLRATAQVGGSHGGASVAESTRLP